MTSVRLAGVVAAGDLNRARDLADQAEALARSSTDPDQQPWALVRLVEAVAAAGDLDCAETLARSITDPNHQAWALVRLVEAVAAAGDLDLRRNLARSIPALNQEAWELAGLAKVAEPARARRVVAWALRIEAWTVPLVALAIVEPTALLTVACDFTSDRSIAGRPGRDRPGEAACPARSHRSHDFSAPLRHC